MKFIRKLFYIIVLVCILTKPYITYASSIKYDMSSNGTKRYYVSTKDENFLMFNLIRANIETETEVIYSGEMLNVDEHYLQLALKYNQMYQSQVLNTEYGTGIYFSYSMAQQSLDKNALLVKYYTTYLENDDQIQFVYDTVRNAIKSNSKYLKTNYQKILWAYQWVLDKFKYDKTYSEYSAYAGFKQSGTVCQGYATMLCVALKELGVESVFVEGSVYSKKEVNHAWNIVKLDGKWYCVDPTWGDQAGAEKYFLKSIYTMNTEEYGHHVSDLYDNYINAGQVFADEDYINNGSEENTPLSPTVYDIEMSVFKENHLAIGEKFQFAIYRPKDIWLEYDIEDPTIIMVDKNGVITALKDGTTTITAYNKGYNIAQSCIITVK